MDIEKLCNMQEALDNRIIAEKEIKWTSEERFFNTLVSLDVELSEFANEGRWFKRWSMNQEPSKKLLEEFVDALHFFLSIANQKGWQEELYFHFEAMLDLQEEGFDGGLNGIFLETKFGLMKLMKEDKSNLILGKSKHKFFFKNAWFCFLAMGMIGFNFSDEQIEDAYMQKNDTNWKRQANGY